MKNALLAPMLLALILISCGPSEEERAQGQAEREAQINNKIKEVTSQESETELIDLASDTLNSLDTLRIDSADSD